MIKAKNFIEMGKAEEYSYNGDIIYNVLLEKHEKMITHNMIVETLDPHSIIGKLYNKYILDNKLLPCLSSDLFQIFG